jgi:ribulose-phosphate 3-epimerase
MSIKIAPSILSADFGKLNEEVASIEAYADLLHVDVMDGHFVPNLSFGAPVFACVKTALPLDCHLMVEDPQNYIEQFKKAGAFRMTVHFEVCAHLHRVVQEIKAAGMEAGVALNPATSVAVLENILDELDHVLIMSVNPGFGGQSFIAESVNKVAKLRAMSTKINIGVDGGINAETAKLVKAAGCDLLIAGSYVFGSKDRVAAIESLR